VQVGKVDVYYHDYIHDYFIRLFIQLDTYDISIFQIGLTEYRQSIEGSGDGDKQEESNGTDRQMRSLLQ